MVTEMAEADQTGRRYRLSLEFGAADDRQAERLGMAWAGTAAAEWDTCNPVVTPVAGPVSWVDQARGISLRLLAAIEASGIDLATADRHLAQALASSPALFWARGEEQPPGEWRDTGKDDS